MALFKKSKINTIIILYNIARRYKNTRKIQDHKNTRRLRYAQRIRQVKSLRYKN